MNITVPNNLTIGQSVTLDCSAVTVKGITSRVDIVWYSGVQVRRVNNVTASIINDTAAVYRDSLNISSLTGKHDNRLYSCQTIINSDPLVAVISSVRLNVTCKSTIKCMYILHQGRSQDSLKGGSKFSRILAADHHQEI